MNQLADSLSPYLLQHKDNPVNWFPWGDEAFTSAKQRDVPIFLSVGYAACHWCHVMEHESFENEEIAAYLNEHFVSIKVDREERPDIDQIYMNAVQLMAGRGGWPMSVFLDHDRRPFYAGTYWPASQRFNMPSFPQVLDALVDAWTHRRAEIHDHSSEISDALSKLAEGTGQRSDQVPGEQVIEAGTDNLLQALDRQDGGFGGAPKFPHATDLALLLRRGHCINREGLIAAAELTLDHMAGGGIRDHIGGGFSRYSVDTHWLVPHFEKMLYDNALLANVYIRAFQVTGHQRHARVAEEIFQYLCRDMVDADGGFHCSEDADSEGVEGRFYVWTPDEVMDALGADRGKRFCQVYDITATGNFEGQSIPNLRKPIDAWAAELNMAPDRLHAELTEDRQKLFQVRSQRVHPGRDDKIITAWNSLAIEALAIGGSVLDEQRFVDAAVRAADFIHERMRDPDGRLLHAFRGGSAHLDGYVDDYAYSINAFIALYEATGQTQWVDRGLQLADAMVEHFADPEHGGFFYTADDAETLITRNKDWHDGSLISGNASAVTALLKLSRLANREDYRQLAEQTFQLADEVLTKQASACGALLAALDRYWNDNKQLVLSVSDEAMMRSHRQAFSRNYRPNTTHAWILGQPSETGPLASLIQGKPAVSDQPTLYRCEDFACEQPLVGKEALDWL